MVSINKPKFQLGKIVATHGALEALDQSNQDPKIFLKKHLYGDWGDICNEDAQLNDEAVAHEGEPDKQQRVLSSYKTSKNETIWIITEYDRKISTILLPSDY